MRDTDQFENYAAACEPAPRQGIKRLKLRGSDRATGVLIAARRDASKRASAYRDAARARAEKYQLWIH